MAWRKRRIFFLAVAALAMGLFTSCTKSSDSDDAPSDGTDTSPANRRYYATTSTTGGFGQWTVIGETHLSGNWIETDSLGNTSKTIKVEASCSAPNADMTWADCAVDSSSCTDGTSTCVAGDAIAVATPFHVQEVPNVSLVVTGLSTDTTFAHIGISHTTTCPASSGTTQDFVFIRIGRQRGIFGLMRASPLYEVMKHIHFQMSVSVCNGTTDDGNCTANPSMSGTSLEPGYGEAPPDAVDCESGVMTMRFDMLSGNRIVHAAQSSTGLILQDYGTGNGGLIGYPNTAVAHYSEVIKYGSSRTFKSFFSSDVDAASVFDFEVQAYNGIAKGAYLNYGSLMQLVQGPVYLKEVRETQTPSIQSPKYPVWTLNPMGASSLSPDYPNSVSIPGLYFIDGAASGGSTTRRYVMLFFKVNDKVMGLGTAYDWRRSAVSVRNIGTFLLNEK